VEYSPRADGAVLTVGFSRAVVPPWGMDGRNILLRSPISIRDIIVEHVKAAQDTTLAPADGWSLAAIGQAVAVTFRSGPGALKYLGERPDIQLSDRTETGYVQLSDDAVVSHALHADMGAMETFIRKMPKAELHLNIEASRSTSALA
jgi:hypothetical protein